MLKESMNISLGEGRRAYGGTWRFLPCSQCVFPKPLLLVPVWDRLLGQVCRADVRQLVLNAKHKEATAPLKSREVVMGGSLGVPTGPGPRTKPQQHPRAASFTADPLCLNSLRNVFPFPFRHPTASQPSAVSCQHQPCLPTPRQPKCHLT